VAPSTPVIVVSGPPASGKTFVAETLAERLAVPLIAKDTIKEILYDELGLGDLAWSQQLGRATFALLFRALEDQARARKPAIVEANFGAAARERFLDLGKTFGIRYLEIHCTADPGTLVARYAARAGSRHAGHLDEQRIDDVRATVAGGTNGALGLGAEVLVVDTTSFAAVDIAAVTEAARAYLMD
jgi:predicted kinase